MSRLKSFFRNWSDRFVSRKQTEVVADHAESETGSDQPVTRGLQDAAVFSFSKDWWEWAVILLAVFLFCSIFLDLKSNTTLPGPEAELFQSYDWVFYNSLAQYKQFPLWNPYVDTGVSYVGDPMLHIYNPVVALPILLLGVQDGFKLALYFSFLLAAFGMWRLGKVLGLSGPARVWMALMYAFAGQPIARFFQGEYLFVFSFAWIPWIFSSLLRMAYTRRRRYIAEAVLFIALLFFCGNGYNQFYLLFLIVFLALAMLFEIRAGKGQKAGRRYLALDLVFLKNLVIVAVLTLGITSIHLLPMSELWPWMNKDLTLEGGHSLSQIFLDYTSKDNYRADAFIVYPAPEEFYAYIGLTPFLALILLPLAWSKADKRILFFLFMILGFVIVWIRLEDFPWSQFFVDTRFLIQFRILLRVLIFGSFALFVLSAIGLDRLWKNLISHRQRFSASTSVEQTRRTQFGYWAAVVGLILVSVFMAVGVIDLYTTHRKFLQPLSISEKPDNVLRWLHQSDSSAYFVRPRENNTWYKPLLSQSMRYIDMWFPYFLIRSPGGFIYPRFVQAKPHYVIQPAADAPTLYPDMEKVEEVEGYGIYRLANSLPVAFLVADEKLANDAGGRWLDATDVTPVEPFFPGPNDVEVIASGSNPDGSQGAGYKLVALITRVPGWQLKVDGQRYDLLDVGGYLAAELLPGTHRYVFSYRPKMFYLGLALCLISLSIVFYWLKSDIKVNWQEVKQLWQQMFDKIRQLRHLPGRWSRSPELEVDAVTHEGGFLPDQPVALADGRRVHLTIHPLAENANPLRVAFLHWLKASGRLLRTMLTVGKFETWLFCVSILVYLATRLYGLLDYPIYFFTDEAVQTLLAQDLVQKGLMGPDGQFLPTYFPNVDHYNLSVSVYLQVIPYLLFGKSAYLTRMVSVLMTLLAAVSVGLILRDVFKLSHWWTATLFLSITPAWFLHSRTAFEVVLMVSFYAAALYYYSLYRYRNPRYLYAALILFALAFYTYSPAQVVVVVTGIGLLFSDFGYHWQNRKIGFLGLGLVALMTLPYIRFRLVHPGAINDHLILLNSYWVQNISFQEKLQKFWNEYSLGLSPAYWFFPNGRDLDRHVMKGYGHLLRATLPFVALGLLICLKKIRSSAHRLLLVALLASPSGAAIAQVAVTRALGMVIPASLLAALGLITALGWLEKLRLPRRFLALVVLAALSLVNVWILRDALVNGPTWFQNYGLGGMQYGGRQVFTAAEQYSYTHPDARVVVSPIWANGPDLLKRFFLPENLAVSVGSIYEYMANYKPIDPLIVYVMTPEEYQNVLASGKFQDIEVDQTLSYPNGQPGFYFVRLRYADNIQDILAAERLARQELVEGVVILDGESVRVQYSRLDMGGIGDILDGNLTSVVRTLEANPFIIRLTFSQPRQISGLTLVVGDTEQDIRVLLYTPGASEPVELNFSIDASLMNPQGSIDFGQTYTVTALYLEIKDKRQTEPANIHLWEVIFK